MPASFALPLKKIKIFPMAGVRTHDTSHTVRLYSTLQHPRLLVFRLSGGKIVFYKYDVGSMT
ncbi:hypothetical protein WDU94_014561 [Cyamophila willieti]